MALDLKRFIARFVGEARDQLARLEAGLAALERAPDDDESINALFRSAHTIKGSARMLKLSGLAETAHHLEDVLAAMRDGRLRSDAAIGRLMLRAVDAMNARVDLLEANGADPDPPEARLCELLALAAAGEPFADAGPKTPPETQPVTQPLKPLAAPPDADAADAGNAEPRIRTPDTVRVPLAKLDELIRLLGELAASQARLGHRLRDARALDLDARALAQAFAEAPAVDPDRLHVVRTSALAGSEAGAETGAQTGAETGAETGAGKIAAHALAVRGFTRDFRDDLLAQEQLTTALSERALVLRMLPLSMLFEPSLRMVRDLARALGKEVNCEASGGEIELDRRIIDRLGDCLVHCLRNAVDHGLEPADERRAAGKPEVGQVRLVARHAGAGVVIEVSDDGRGLSRERILAKALQRELIDKVQAATLTDEQAFELIFEPGFSTSEIITDVSGRGVGMDVIKHTVIDELHGAITLTSRLGQGSTLGFKLPLSLAVMRVLLFDSGGHRFGFSAQHVAELIRVTPSETIVVAGRPAVVLRNEFVPLIPLAELIGLSTSAPNPEGARSSWVVVIGVRQSKLGVVVDRLFDEHDMVIKSLPEHLRGCHLVGGVVVTGDNQLVSVLQAPTVMELARRAWGESVTVDAQARGQRVAADRPRHILVVDDSLNTREIEKEVLESQGYQVTTAEDGLDGWQKAVGGGFDAVLTDVEMPRLDGFSLTAKLREHDAYRNTPVVIITSRQKEEDKRRGIQVGADAYIVKGDFDQSSLLDTLRDLLG